MGLEACILPDVASQDVENNRILFLSFSSSIDDESDILINTTTARFKPPSIHATDGTKQKIIVRVISSHNTSLKLSGFGEERKTISFRYA